VSTVSETRKCDRCGELHVIGADEYIPATWYTGYFPDPRRSGESGSQWLDMCPACVRDFARWVKPGGAS
jgi:hypothetical protein